MKKQTRLLAGISLLVLAALVAGGFFWRARTQRPQAIAVRRGPVVEAVYGLGTVTATRTYQVKVGVSESIQKLFVREGAWVKKGAPLVAFGEPPIRTAPFDGTVTSVPFREGELVFPQVPILTLVDLRDLFLEVLLEQQAAMRIRPGQQATVSFESLRGQKLQGSVASIYPREGQFILRIELAEMPAGILPGMTADVAVLVGKKDQALLIPVRGVGSGRAVVLRAETGKKQKIDLKLGVVDGEWAEVLEGDLKEGDSVLVETR